MSKTTKATDEATKAPQATPSDVVYAFEDGSGVCHVRPAVITTIEGPTRAGLTVFHEGGVEYLPDVESSPPDDLRPGTWTRGWHGWSGADDPRTRVIAEASTAGGRERAGWGRRIRIGQGFR